MRLDPHFPFEKVQGQTRIKQRPYVINSSHCLQEEIFTVLINVRERKLKISTRLELMTCIYQLIQSSNT
jgi:hypothetical protein